MAQITSIQDFLLNTDFAELKKQKRALYKVQTALTAIGGEENTELVETLDGLICFIDSFQDMAVDVYGEDEDKVFYDSSPTI